MNEPLSIVRIPIDRVPVLLGKNGETKKRIEEGGRVRLIVDSQNGEIHIFQNGDPILAALAPEVIRAVGRGFNPEKASMLYSEGMQLAVIPLREFAKAGSHRIVEIKGRIIGRSGRTRRTIEMLTDAHICVYGDTVSIIGNLTSLPFAMEAIRMIINGRKHRTVYQYLERFKREEKGRKIRESFGDILE
ncbi:MAG: RNA-processing protein [Candidatus Thermoplasmatota archaeon]|nr:RNA-processing protein [Candidatus Thermoplasmatota archaeon]MCL5438149.1 RNA-processing protein [Candidatus Thermoplasmatota archaeon]